MDFNIETEIIAPEGIGDVAVLKLAGVVNQKSLPYLEAAVQELYKKNICYLIFDLSGSKMINSTGLGLFINIAHQVEMSGGGVCLVNVAEKLKVLFDMLGLGDRFPVHDTLDVALSAWKK